MQTWIGKAIAKMHINGISQRDVSDKMGITYSYLSEILNGKKTPKTAKERVNTAIEEIIEERKKNNDIS